VYFQKEENEELMMNEQRKEGSAMCLLCHEIVMGNKLFNLSRKINLNREKNN
jgi:hypothetical protein